MPVTRLPGRLLRGPTTLAALVAAVLVLVGLAGPARAAPAGPPATTAAVVGPSLPSGSWSAPAVVRLCWNCGDDLVVARASNGRLFYGLGAFGVSAADENFTRHGWLEIPGNGVTPYAPSVARIGDYIYVGVVGGGGSGLWLQRLNWKTWTWNSGWSPVPGGGVFSNGPAIAGYLDQALWVSAPGGDRRVYSQYWDGVSWTGTWRVEGSLRTNVAIAATEHQYSMHLFARGDDRRIYHRVALVPFGTPTEWQEIPGGGMTDDSPAAAANVPGSSAFERLVVAVRGLNGGIAYQKLQNSTWNPGWNWLPQPGWSLYGPALWSAGDYVKAFTTSGDHAVYVQHLKHNWQDGQTLIYSDPSGLPGWLRVPRSLPTTPVPPTLPDLAFTGPPTWNAQTKRIEIGFKNYGNAAAGGFRVSAQVDNGAVGELVFNGLGAGQTGTVSWGPGFLVAGDHTYNFVLDLYNTVTESDEGNNGHNGYFTV